jgi:hypothetical protein
MTSGTTLANRVNNGWDLLCSRETVMHWKHLGTFVNCYLVTNCIFFVAKERRAKEPQLPALCNRFNRGLAEIRATNWQNVAAFQFQFCKFLHGGILRLLK